MNETRRELLNMLAQKNGYQGTQFKEPPAPASVRSARKIIHKWQAKVDKARRQWQKKRKPRVEAARREIFFGSEKKALELIGKL